MPINSFLYPGAKVTSAYQVDNSLRFNDGDSAYLNITPSSASNRKTWTWSSWVKLGTISGDKGVFSASSDDSNRNSINIVDEGYIIFDYEVGGTRYLVSTQDARYRDPSAWFHIVVAVDTTQSTSTNRVKIYVNGSQVTLSTILNGYPPEDADMFINNNVAHSIGKQTWGSAHYDGYIAEAVLIDGSALTPSSFGEFDEDSPTIWKPKDVSGLTFGTNGFYLEFKQSGTSQNSSGLGADTSGNDNHFASNNLAATDQSTDTCTNNFATFNPAAPTTDITLSEGNLKGVYGTSGTRTVQTSTFGLSSGKWYWEIKIGGSTSPNNAMVGITQLSTDTNTVLGTADNSWAYRGYDGKVYHNNADEGGSLDTFTDGDIIGIALNLDNLQGSLHKLYFSKNGTFQNGADPTDFTSATGVYGVDDNVDYFPAVSDAGSSATPQFEINFGSPSFSISSGNSDANGYGNFEYAVPSGFYAINSKNLAEFG